MAITDEYPRIRCVEAIPDLQAGRIILRDPTQLAAGMLVLGLPEFALISMLDGTLRRTEIPLEYARRFGQHVLLRDLDRVLEQLDGASFLDGRGFEAFYARRLEEYREAPCRPLRDAGGFGALPGGLPGALDEALAEADATHDEGAPDAPGAGGRERGGPVRERNSGRLVGLVTPHLDYPRGRPCYGASYARVRTEERPRRVGVLGTNHFGRSRSVVATGKDFATPWGVVATDREFLARLQAD